MTGEPCASQTYTDLAIETIELGFSARLFGPSDYLFTLEGLTKPGIYIHISKYPFTVTIK